MPEVHHAAARLDLSIVLPAFNEEQALAGVIREIREALGDSRATWEIVVVDDGSTDRTAEVAEQHSVRLVRRVETGGYGAAVKLGVTQAAGDLVALLDADGTYPAIQIPELLSFFPDYDQVNGARTSEQGRTRALRIPAKWLIRKLAEWISGQRIPDLNTGMKICKREMLLRYLWVIPDGFSCSTSLTLAFLCNGHPVKYVPVAYRPRQGRSKFRPFQDGGHYCFTVFRMLTYFRPLRVFVPLAVGLGILAVGKSLYDAYLYPSGLSDSDVILAVGSLIVLVIGLLADLIVAQRRNLR